VANALRLLELILWKKPKGMRRAALKDLKSGKTVIQAITGPPKTTLGEAFLVKHPPGPSWLPGPFSRLWYYFATRQPVSGLLRAKDLSSSLKSFSKSLF
jgi:hypothetical protein